MNTSDLGSRLSDTWIIIAISSYFNIWLNIWNNCITIVKVCQSLLVKY